MERSCRFSSEAEPDFLIWFPGFMGSDLDRDFLVEAFQEVEQLVRREPAEVSVHQVGDLRLLDPEERRGLTLLELSRFEQFMHMKS
jgi:hypothetical protein